MSFSRLSMVVLAGVLALPVFADVSDDAIKLAQSGVTEDVIVAWCEHQNVSNLTAQDILRMRDGKVPDRAIAAIIRSASASGNRQLSQSVPASSNTTEYVDTPSTTYVYSSPYYSSYPYYYGGYYGYPYYRSYGWGGSGIGFNFRFGGGHGGFHHHR